MSKNNSEWSQVAVKIDLLSDDQKDGRLREFLEPDAYELKSHKEVWQEGFKAWRTLFGPNTHRWIVWLSLLCSVRGGVLRRRALHRVVNAGWVVWVKLKGHNVALPPGADPPTWWNVDSATGLFFEALFEGGTSEVEWAAVAPHKHSRDGLPASPKDVQQLIGETLFRAYILNETPGTFCLQARRKI